MIFQPSGNMYMIQRMVSKVHYGFLIQGTKFASGITSFINKKTTPSKTISPAEEKRLREVQAMKIMCFLRKAIEKILSFIRLWLVYQARLKEKEQKESERQQRIKESKEADIEEKRRKNKERQERAEQLRLEREKMDAANRFSFGTLLVSWGSCIKECII